METLAYASEQNIKFFMTGSWSLPLAPDHQFSLRRDSVPPGRGRVTAQPPYHPRELKCDLIAGEEQRLTPGPRERPKSDSSCSLTMNFAMQSQLL
jgi:hypothetical protein